VADLDLVRQRSHDVRAELGIAPVAETLKHQIFRNGIQAIPISDNYSYSLGKSAEGLGITQRNEA
jgi:hypothetical protein